MSIILDSDYSLAAGKQETFEVEGRFIRLIKTNVPGGRLEVATQQGDRGTLTVGRGLPLSEGVTQVSIRNPETFSQDFTVTLSSEPDYDTSIPGTVVVASDSALLSVARSAFFKCIELGAVPAAYNNLQLYNVLTSRRFALPKLRVKTDTAQGIRISVTASGAATLTNLLSANMPLKVGGNLTGGARQYFDTPALPGGGSFEIPVNANEWTELVYDAPVILNPSGGAIAINSTVVNATLTVYVEGYEVL